MGDFFVIFESVPDRAISMPAMTYARYCSSLLLLCFAGRNLASRWRNSVSRRLIFFELSLNSSTAFPAMTRSAGYCACSIRSRWRMRLPASWRRFAKRSILMEANPSWQSTARASNAHYEKGRAHMPPMMVSVWGVTMRMTFAQTEAGEGGEAEAAVKLLKSISLKSCVVTADAIHCDRRVVETVKHRGGDYVIALKRNQRNLLASVTALVDVASSGARSAEISEKGHGRQERRSIVVVPRRVLRTNMASKASSQRLVLPANVLLMAKPVIRSTTTSRLVASRRMIFLRSFEVIGTSKTAVIGSRTWSSTKTSQEIERKMARETLHYCAV